MAGLTNCRSPFEILKIEGEELREILERAKIAVLLLRFLIFGVVRFGSAALRIAVLLLRFPTAKAKQVL